MPSKADGGGVQVKDVAEIVAERLKPKLIHPILPERDILRRLSEESTALGRCFENSE